VGGLLCGWIHTQILPGRPRDWIGSVIAALAWGSAPLIWTHALIVEVYALHALFVTLFLWWFSLLTGGSAKTWRLAGLSLCLGLATGNHLTILLLAPAALAGLVLGRRAGRPLPQLALFAGLALAGTLVYAYLPLAARSYPAINWGNPQTWSGFWWDLSGDPYQGLLFGAPALSVAERIPAWARLLVEQFGLPGIILGVFGAVQSKFPRPALRRLLVWIAAAYSAFAVLYQTGDSMVYLLPAYLAWAVWLALGVDLLLDWRWKQYPAGKWLTAAAALFLLVRLPLTAAQVKLPTPSEAAVFAENVLKTAPQGAILVTTNDTDTFPLWYHHFGLKERPDLHILVHPLGQFNWYRETLMHLYPDLTFPPLDAKDWADALLRDNPALAVCRTVDDASSGKKSFQCKN